MKPPKRNPDRVLAALRNVLAAHPELRVGQAISNALPANYGNDSFYVEDDVLAESLENLLRPPEEIK